jgi:hypothetical protein
MKRYIILFLLLSLGAQAQTPYRTSLGLGIDVGDGSSFFGPQVKHVFGRNAAIQGQVMFSDHNFMYVGADYQ